MIEGGVDKAHVMADGLRRQVQDQLQSERYDQLVVRLLIEGLMSLYDDMV